jgi:DNA-binding transcriptional LysR family regulator
VQEIPRPNRDAKTGRFRGIAHDGDNSAGFDVLKNARHDFCAELARFVTAVSPAYLKLHGAPETPQELTKHSCIRFRLPSGALVPWRLGRKRRTFEVEVKGSLTSNEPGIAIRAAVDGAGLIQLPLPYLAPELAAGRLVRVFADWDQPRVDAFYLYYSSRRQMRPPLKALVDFLRNAGRKPQSA